MNRNRQNKSDKIRGIIGSLLILAQIAAFTGLGYFGVRLSSIPQLVVFLLPTVFAIILLSPRKERE